MHLLDNSAWARLDLGTLPPAVREDVAQRVSDGAVAICTPFLLEAGWSARNAADHDGILEDLLHLPRFPISADVEDAAVDAQRSLARRGHHRSASPTDLLIAACAHVHGVGVLHYDRDYDILGDHTELTFDSAWLAPPGSL